MTDHCHLDDRPDATPGGGRPQVVFVSMARGLGGPGRSLLTVLGHLDDEVERVLFAPPGQLARVAQQRGIVEHYLPMPWQARARGVSRIQATAVLARYVRANRARIRAIHANGQTELNLSALPLRRTGVPVVMWAHTSRSSPTAATLAGFWRRPDRPVTWLAVSDTARQVLAATLGLDPAVIDLVPNPIDPAEVVAGPDLADPHRGDQHPARPTIAFLGQPWQIKGWRLLPEVIDAVGGGVRWQIFASRPDPAVLPVDTAVWDRLAARAARDDDDVEVALTGRVGDVRRAYAACDVVFCPSEQESLPRVTAEAMLNGLPVVGSDLPAYQDLLADPGAGLLFPVGDPAAAGAALRQLVDDPALRRQLGARGKEHAQRYTPDRIVPLLARAYASAGRRTAGGTD